jgi:hypothetical protein
MFDKDSNFDFMRCPKCGGPVWWSERGFYMTAETTYMYFRMKKDQDSLYTFRRHRNDDFRCKNDDCSMGSNFSDANECIIAMLRPAIEKQIQRETFFGRIGCVFAFIVISGGIAALVRWMMQ